MSVRMKATFEWSRIATYILPCAIVGSLVEMYLGMWAIDTVVKLLAILISLLVIVKGGYHRGGFLDTLILGYIFYCLLTGVSYLWNGRPISCYFADISDFLLPICFVYVGLNDIHDRKMYDRFLTALIPIFLLGLLCYLTTPGWYTTRLAEVMNSQWYINGDVYDEESVLSVARFMAFFRTSYPVSHFTVFGISIVCFNFLRIDKRSKYTTASLLVLIVSVVLCMHRVAIACMVLFLGITLLLSFKSKSRKRLWPVIIMGVGIIAVLVYGATNERYQDVFSMVSERIEDMSVGNALKERKQIREVMSTWDNFIFGQGIGSGGAAARSAGFYGITDQNYVKLLYETGIFGFIFLAFILGITLIRGLKYYQYYLTEVMIIAFILIAMLGSNSLVIYYTYTILFWYAVGRIWNRRYLQNAITNRIKI